MSKAINNTAIGDEALEFLDRLLTPEEKAASALRVSIIEEMVKARTSYKHHSNSSAGKTI